MLPCPFNTMHPAAAAAAAAFGLQTSKPPNSGFFNLDRLQLTTVNAASPNFSLANFSPYTIPAAYPPWDHMAAVTVKALGFGMFDPRQARLIQEEPKPQHSYIGLIAMAILSSAERKMVLCDIYQWILDHYPYFRTRGPGWRNSIRHNLSLNDCFIKAGRSANGKGHYWAIHPANVDDFKRGDFRRRRAQRKVRKHMGLTSIGDGDDSEDDSLCPSPATASSSSVEPKLASESATPTKANGNESTRKKRLFDVESLLAPEADEGSSESANGSPTTSSSTASHALLEPSSTLFSQALSAWSMNHSSLGGWPAPPQPATITMQPGTAWPDADPRSTDNRQTPSPYSAEKWQQTFAKIMARSYHWRNGSVKPTASNSEANL
ncbi:Fork head domain-containing protein FD5 [Trichinella papuae]|uniref:Fork head domain-containing protein FD5 n=1 Tax=Trichinella papuae TaxID=268474 RepID=A0A0V1MBP6_9BILA|nr:Fork head domain-containing protein FD5 [Trichinella papuae]